MTPAGFPHSGTPGSTPVCGFPGLIAAYHALHRLLVPRHPPYALSSLTPLSLRGVRAEISIPTRTLTKRSVSWFTTNAMQLSKSLRDVPARILQRPPADRAALVEMSGVEPPTPCVQSRCSPD